MNLNPFMRLLEMPEAEVTFKKFGNPIPLFKPPVGNMKVFRKIDEKDSITVDVDTFLQTHAQCSGITDSGKTNTGAVCAEQLLNYGVKIVVFDSSKQDFISLADDYPAKVKVMGFDKNPEEVAKEFYENDNSIVFDNLGVEKSVFVPFTCQFLRACFKLAMQKKGAVDAARNSRQEKQFIRPFKIFIDEAQDYLPSDISTVSDGELRGWIKQLISIVESIHRQGRAYGITFFLMCQRLTDMITSIRSQTGMFFLHQQSAFTEKEYYMKIIGSSNNRERNGLKEAIQGLKKGQCYYVIGKNTMKLFVMRRVSRHGSKPIGLKDVVGWSESR